ncbi:hypothetical protein [Streptomyces sp. NPDC052042]|uniref:hypothetical protein n=1 Tax=Streptomyces sp. NPDC052042 TaxID=3365683 RepID=UPI0037D7B4C3
MRRVVRAFWGPRPEPAEALAGRWKRTLDGITALLPEAAPPGDTTGTGPWRQVQGSGPETELPADEGALLGALRVAQAAEDWSDLTGTALRLHRTGAPGWRTEVSALAGGAPEFLLQSFVMTLHTPEGAEVPEAELLSAIAREWEPDFGDVSDDDVLDALEDDAGYCVGDPVVGRVGYLSSGRAALVPDGLVADREEPLAGGVLLRIAGAGASDEVVAAYERLRDAGALDPLRRPMDRAVL